MSTRPRDIIHGNDMDLEQSMRDCILVFLTVEKDDVVAKNDSLVKEVVKFSDETGHNNIFLCPFAHLSNNLAPSKVAIEVLNDAVIKLKNKFNIQEGHFGSDKELFIHLYGHPGNARFREF